MCIASDFQWFCCPCPSWRYFFQEPEELLVARCVVIPYYVLLLQCIYVKYLMSSSWQVIPSHDCPPITWRMRLNSARRRLTPLDKLGVPQRAWDAACCHRLWWYDLRWHLANLRYATSWILFLFMSRTRTEHCESMKHGWIRLNVENCWKYIPPGHEYSLWTPNTWNPLP